MQYMSGSHTNGRHPVIWWKCHSQHQPYPIPSPTPPPQWHSHRTTLTAIMSALQSQSIKAFHMTLYYISQSNWYNTLSQIHINDMTSHVVFYMEVIHSICLIQSHLSIILYCSNPATYYLCNMHNIVLYYIIYVKQYVFNLLYKHGNLISILHPFIILTLEWLMHSSDALALVSIRMLLDDVLHDVQSCMIRFVYHIISTLVNLVWIDRQCHLYGVEPRATCFRLDLFCVTLVMHTALSCVIRQCIVVQGRFY